MQFFCHAVVSLMAWQGWTPDWIHYFKQNTSSAPQVGRHQVRRGTKILQSLNKCSLVSLGNVYVVLAVHTVSLPASCCGKTSVLVLLCILTQRLLVPVCSFQFVLPGGADKPSVPSSQSRNGVSSCLAVTLQCGETGTGIRSHLFCSLT